MAQRGRVRRNRRLHPPPKARAKQLTPQVAVVKLQIPPTDWSAVRIGEKREFRCYRPNAEEDRTARPVLLWSPEPYVRDAIRSELAIIEESWSESLGAISAASLEAEGYAGLPDFRAYFVRRYPKRGFRPLDVVRVYRLRPWEENDDELAADWLLARALPWAFGDVE